MGRHVWGLLCGAVAAHLLTYSAANAGTLANRFEVFLQGNLRPIADSFATAVGRSIPVIAASPSFHYEFNPETGSFTRSRATGGQLFIEHAQPLGQGHVALDLYYLHVQFDRLGGQPLRDFGDPYPVLRLVDVQELVYVPESRIPDAKIDVSADEVLFSATYGLLSWLDVNVAVPFIYTVLARSETVEVVNFETGIPLGRSLSGSSTDVAAGVGDLVLRTKARLGVLAGATVAADLGLRVPTGDRDDFQGTGAVEVTPMLILSTPAWRPASELSLQGHLNLALLIDTDDPTDRSEGRWGVGMDLVSRSWQLTVGLHGRHATGSIFSTAQIERLTFPTCVAPALRQCLPETPPRFRAQHTLFGLTSERPDYLDGSIGIRIALWKETVTGVLGMLAPLLDEGLTTDPVPIAGIEAVF